MVHLDAPGHPSPYQPAPKHGRSSPHQPLRAPEGPLLRLLCRARRDREFIGEILFPTGSVPYYISTMT